MLPLTDRVYDVAVVGGGILGVSVARDCAMRRLSVILFEKEDLGSGTTGAGSGLLSGEPQWLATDPEATRETCEEINVLQRIAPNLLSRVPILYPVLGSDPKSELDRLEALADYYDRYAVVKSGRPHVRLAAKDLAGIEPGLSRECVGAISLDEWTADPQRITVAIARSAVSAGAYFCKGVRVEKVETQNKKVVGVRAVAKGGKGVMVRARTVVNAAGPWGPLLAPRRSVEFRFFQRTYLFLERRATEVALACPTSHRAEPVFFLPRENFSVIGSSEIPFKGKPEDVKPSVEEVASLIEAVKRYFPRIEMHRFTSVVSGVHCRVLDLEHQEGHHQAVFDHSSDGSDGLYSLIGGSIPRARRLAEQVTDLICRKLRQKERCRTHLESLPGCTSEVPWLEEARRTGRDPVLVARLIRRYGHKAADILDAASRQTELGHTLCECEQVLAAEAEHSVRKEWATSLSDLRRRTRLGMGTCQGCRCLGQGASFLGSLLGWSPEEWSAQIASQPEPFPTLTTWQEQTKQKEFAHFLQGFGGGDD